MKALEYWQAEVAARQAQGLYRVLRRADGPSAARTTMEERELILLCSNNYLGLTTHPRVVAAAREALEQYGTGSGGSRLISGNLALHQELERDLAAWKATADAILFGSGYAANLGSISALVGPGDLIFSDQLNHASIIDGCRLSRARVLIYRHGDLHHLEQLLKETDTCAGRRMVVSDTVFSMDGDLAPLPDLVALAHRHDVLVMVDEAHATGVLGARGAGAVDFFGLEGQVEVQLSTLSKALGAEGGCVAGSKVLVDYLRQRARSFIYSTAPAPPAVAAARAAVALVHEDPGLRRSLAANAAYLRERLRHLGFLVPDQPTPIIPMVVGEAERALHLAQALEQRGVWAPAIRPPTVPPGTSRLRLSVMATHTLADLDTAVEALKGALVEIDAAGGCWRGGEAWQASL